MLCSRGGINEGGMVRRPLSEGKVVFNKAQDDRHHFGCGLSEVVLDDVARVADRSVASSRKRLNAVSKIRHDSVR
jgi:NADPH-dependent 2,4-dienoyl-CoA reductase/sulfur reductase-like enzyme